MIEVARGSVKLEALTQAHVEWESHSTRSVSLGCFILNVLGLGVITEVSKITSLVVFSN